MYKKIFGLHIIFFLLSYNLPGQEMSTLYGVVSDTAGYSVGFANVAVLGTRYGTTADKYGKYELQIPAGTQNIVITCVGYQTKKIQFIAESGKKNKFDITLSEAIENLQEVTVSKNIDQTGTIHRIDAHSMKSIPNPSGNFENIIKQMPGVASNNELSSQYSVRGGSFDENLVYVNDIEIYRSFLIQSGQQEGLSFVNPDLVGSIKFSAGGFDASYGDKMASVLDITYKHPSENTGSFDASVLGGSFHYEGISKDQHFKYLTGIRYKTSKYLLTSTDTKGEYNPSFIDFQNFLSYDLTPKFEISFLGNYGQNKYDFVPTDRTTDFGTYQIPLQLKVYYEGKENDIFVNALGAITLNYHRNENFSLKLITSAYNTSESVTYDILGEYLINQLDYTNQKSDSALRIGIGSMINHARNYLNANVFTVSHIGNFNININKIKWGISLQREIIQDKMNEWNLIDSAGYSVPYSTNEIDLMNVSHSKNTLSSNRVFGYLMNKIDLVTADDKISINAGIRVHYWDLNHQTVFNPRFSILYKPHWQQNILIYFATGFYNQPPFYKELRNPQGDINRNLKAQNSIHYVLGANYTFFAFTKPFKLTSELYYKDFNNLVPYKIDNVQTIYAGQNLAVGYATGLDLKLNGEFVKGTESWISLSLLQTRQKLNSSYYLDSIRPFYYPRPTDQLFNLSLFFQDYLPRNPSYKVHLSLHYGSKLPVSIPTITRWDKVYRILPSYKRVDIGFSKMIKGPESVLSSGNIFRFCKEVWLSAEIFNLIDINNTVSYLWVKTVNNNENIPGYFAVPNYLTSRRFNIKLSVSF